MGGNATIRGEWTLPARRLNPGQTTELVIEVARACGYDSVAAGPNSFRLGRSYRPRWSVIAACATGVVLLGAGFAFLLVKRTDHAEASIVEERDGVKVRLTGAASEHFLRMLHSRLEHDGIAPAVTYGPRDFAPTVVSAASGAAWVPPTMLTEVPGASSTVTIDDGDLDRTIAASQLHGLRAPTGTPQAAASVRLRFTTGELLRVGPGVVIGRQPQPPADVPGAVPIAIDDLSLSRTHLCVLPAPTGVWVVDLHSTNGASVDLGTSSSVCTPGERVLVPAGGGVIFGDRRFTVEVG